MSNLPGLHTRLGETWCASASANAENAPVQLEPCDRSEGQQWTFTGSTMQVYGNKCLNIQVNTDGVVVSSNPLTMATCLPGAPLQQFTYTENAFVQANVVKWSGGNFCLLVPNEALFLGNQLQVWTCYTSSTPMVNEIWDFIKQAPPPPNNPGSSPPVSQSRSSSTTTSFTKSTTSTDSFLSTTPSFSGTPTPGAPSSTLSSSPTIDSITSPGTLRALPKFPVAAIAGGVAGLLAIILLFLVLLCLRHKRCAQAPIPTPYPATATTLFEQSSLPRSPRPRAASKAASAVTRFYRQSTAGSASSATSESSRVSLVMSPLRHPIQEEDAGAVEYQEDTLPPAYKATWNRAPH